MKKFVAGLLGLVMCLSLLSGCTGGAGVSSAAAETSASGSEDGSSAGGFQAASEVQDMNVPEHDRFKIVFSYTDYESKHGSQLKNAIQYLCDAYNCEAVFLTSPQNPDDVVTAWESTFAAGDIDGMITVGVTTANMEVAKKYDIPVVAVDAFPSTPEEINGCAAYENFLGGVVGDDAWAGQEMARALYDNGCRNITFSSLTQGLVQSYDDRTRGFKAYLDSQSDIKLLAENYSMGLFADDVSTFHAAFPEIDGMSFAGIGNVVYQALETEGMTDSSIKISGVDIDTQTGKYIDNGVQVWACGGQYGISMLGWALLYNYLLDETRIIEDTTQPIVCKYIAVESSEDFAMFQQYVEDPATPVYNAEEIGQLVHGINPDVTMQDYLNLADNYTLENLISRRA